MLEAKEGFSLDRKQYLAFFAMVIGMFMALLDIQIVASSLSVIGAGLSASSDELSWVQTSYLIAEVIVIPISGFIIKLLSTRIAYFIATFGFTIMSICCAFATNIQTMIIFRGLQGFFGGILIPSVFAIVYIIFPIKQRASITVLVGLVVTLAPTLGATLGGYITEYISWHFMFLLNVIPGIFVCYIIFMYANFDKPNLNLLKKFDYIGIILLSCALATLQYLLEEGNKRDWFDDRWNIFLLFLIIICFVVFIIYELNCDNPILDLTTFSNSNFTFGCIGSFVLGIGLYGAVYLIPIFLFYIADFNSLNIGFTMMMTGVAQFCSAPIAGKMLDSGLDTRVMLGLGFTLFSLGCYFNTFLTVDSRFYELLLPQFLRGLSLMFCFLPINNIALGTLSRERITNASGLYNLMRNLGGAIGLAIINNILNSKTKIFFQYLNENITTNTIEMVNPVENILALLDSRVFDSEKIIYYFLVSKINKHAFVMAINSIFSFISILFAIMIIILPFVSSVKTNPEDSNVH